MYAVMVFGVFVCAHCSGVHRELNHKVKGLSMCVFNEAELKELSKNGKCSWIEVECLGACVSAPMMQINEDYYEDLDEVKTKEILDSLINDKPLKPGSYRGRKNTSPEKFKNIDGDKHA